MGASTATEATSSSDAGHTQASQANMSNTSSAEPVAVITGYSTSTEGSVFYQVQVTSGSAIWTVVRCYSHFLELKAELEADGVTVSTFPRKHLFRSGTSSVIEERQHGLSVFLSAALRVKGFSGCSDFLELNKHTARGRASLSYQPTPVPKAPASPKQEMPKGYLKAARRQIFLIRHAHKMDQVFGWDKFWDEATHKMDTPLSPCGHSMARELGDAFKAMVDNGLTVDHLFVSPHLRCLQTAYPIAAAVGKCMKVESGLKEMPTGHIAGHPEWEGGLLDCDQRSHLFPLLVDNAYEELYTSGAEEASAELYVNRMNEFARAFLATHTKNETHVFVSHNLNLAVLISLLCGCPLMQALTMARRMKVASVTRLYEQADGTWTVDEALGGYLGHMSSQNLAVASGQDHDKDHPFFKKAKSWAFNPTTQSVRVCTDKYAEGGSLALRMADERLVSESTTPPTSFYSCTSVTS